MNKYLKTSKFIKRYIFNYKIYFIVGALFFLFGIIFVLFLRVDYLVPTINQVRGHTVSQFGLKVINEMYLLPFKLFFIISGLILISFGCFFKFKNFRDKIYLSVKGIWQKLLGLKIWQILLILLIANLVFKGVIMFFVPEAKLAPDGAYYIDIARSLLNSEGYIAHTISKLSLAPAQIPYPVFDVPPLFPLFVFLSFKLFGSSFLSAILINVILSILLPILVFLFALEITKKKRTAFLAALLISFNSVLIGLMTFQVARELLFICLILLCFIFLLKKKNYINLMLVGLFLGLTFLTRFEALVLMLPVVFLVLLRRTGFKKGLVQLSFIILIFFVTISPWLLRNYNLIGQPFGIGPRDVALIALDSDQSYEIARASTTSSPEASFKYFRENFSTIIRHTFSKIYNIVLYSLFGLMGSIIILLFSLIGLWVARKERKKYWPLFLFIVINYLFYPFFTGSIRHFYPMIPFFLVFASIGIFKIFELFKEKERKLLVYLLVLVCLFTVSFGTIRAVHLPVYQGQGIEAGKIINHILKDDLDEIETVMYSGHPDILGYRIPGKNIIVFPSKDLDVLSSLIKQYNVNYIVFVKDMEESVYVQLYSLGAKLVHSSQPDPNISLKIYKLE